VAQEALELCPACAVREVPIGNRVRTGFCDVCATQHSIEIYVAEDKRRAEDRNTRWRTAQSREAYAKLRQQRKRFEAFRPATPAPRDVDPAALAVEAIKLLRRGVRPALKSNAQAHAYMDAAEELVKQLGWGPEG
jgi:hypothetical protein